MNLVSNLSIFLFFNDKFYYGSYFDLLKMKS